MPDSIASSTSQGSSQLPSTPLSLEKRRSRASISIGQDASNFRGPRSSSSTFGGREHQRSVSMHIHTPVKRPDSSMSLNSTTTGSVHYDSRSGTPDFYATGESARGELLSPTDTSPSGKGEWDGMIRSRKEGQKSGSISKRLPAKPRYGSNYTSPYSQAELAKIVMTPDGNIPIEQYIAYKPAVNKDGSPIPYTSPYSYQPGGRDHPTSQPTSATSGSTASTPAGGEKAGVGTNTSPPNSANSTPTKMFSRLHRPSSFGHFRRDKDSDKDKEKEKDAAGRDNTSTKDGITGTVGGSGGGRGGLPITPPATAISHSSSGSHTTKPLSSTTAQSTAPTTPVSTTFSTTHQKAMSVSGIPTLTNLPERSASSASSHSRKISAGVNSSLENLGHSLFGRLNPTQKSPAPSIHSVGDKEGKEGKSSKKDKKKEKEEKEREREKEDDRDHDPDRPNMPKRGTSKREKIKRLFRRSDGGSSSASSGHGNQQYTSASAENLPSSNPSIDSRDMDVRSRNSHEELWPNSPMSGSFGVPASGQEGTPKHKMVPREERSPLFLKGRESRESLGGGGGRSGSALDYYSNLEDLDSENEGEEEEEGRDGKEGEAEKGKEKESSPSESKEVKEVEKEVEKQEERDKEKFGKGQGDKLKSPPPPPTAAAAAALADITSPKKPKPGIGILGSLPADSGISMIPIPISRTNVTSSSSSATSSATATPTKSRAFSPPPATTTPTKSRTISPTPVTPSKGPSQQTTQLPRPSKQIPRSASKSMKYSSLVGATTPSKVTGGSSSASTSTSSNTPLKKPRKASMAGQRIAVSPEGKGFVVRPRSNSLPTSRVFDDPGTQPSEVDDDDRSSITTRSGTGSLRSVNGMPRSVRKRLPVRDVGVESPALAIEMEKARERLRLKRLEQQQPPEDTTILPISPPPFPPVLKKKPSFVQEEIERWEKRRASASSSSGQVRGPEIQKRKSFESTISNCSSGWTTDEDQSEIIPKQKKVAPGVVAIGGGDGERARLEDQMEQVAKEVQMVVEAAEAEELAEGKKVVGETGSGASSVDGVEGVVKPISPTVRSPKLDSIGTPPTQEELAKEATSDQPTSSLPPPPPPPPQMKSPKQSHRTQPSREVEVESLDAFLEQLEVEHERSRTNSPQPQPAEEPQRGRGLDDVLDESILFDGKKVAGSILLESSPETSFYEKRPETPVEQEEVSPPPPQQVQEHGLERSAILEVASSAPDIFSEDEVDIVQGNSRGEKSSTKETSNNANTTEKEEKKENQTVDLAMQTATPPPTPPSTSAPVMPVIYTSPSGLRLGMDTLLSTLNFSGSSGSPTIATGTGNGLSQEFRNELLGWLSMNFDRLTEERLGRLRRRRIAEDEGSSREVEVEEGQELQDMNGGSGSDRRRRRRTVTSVSEVGRGVEGGESEIPQVQPTPEFPTTPLLAPTSTFTTSPTTATTPSTTTIIKEVEVRYITTHSSSPEWWFYLQLALGMFFVVFFLLRIYVRLIDEHLYVCGFEPRYKSLCVPGMRPWACQDVFWPRLEC